MKSMQFWKLMITPLSPVHLGSGEDYEPTGYVIDEGALWEFDVLAALQVLPAPERARLDGMLKGFPTERTLRDVQGFFHANRERLIAVSRRQVMVTPEIERFYRERVGKVAQYEDGGRQVQNRLIIERTAWSHGNGSAIVPGSGLKGAVRTALLEALNNGRSLAPDLRQDSRASASLQSQLFGGAFHSDPMRLLRFSDAEVTDPNHVVTSVRFAVNRKKQKVVKDGRELVSQAEKGNLYQLLECLPSFSVRAFEGSLQVVTGDPDTRDWPRHQFGLADIARACNRFYRSLLDRELAIMASMNYIDGSWRQTLESVLGGDVEQAMNSNRAFLVRIGRHSGAEAVTLNGVRNIRINRGKGEKPNWLREAKTLWLAGDDAAARSSLQPFGWVLVEAMPYDERPRSTLVTADDAPTARWIESVAAKQAGLQARLSEELAIEAKRAEQLAEHERTAEEDRRRLEAMSDEERQMETLRSIFANERESGTLTASSQTASERVALLRAALEWESLAHRRQAAELIEQTLKAFPWSKKSKAQRNADLARLKRQE